MKNAISNKFGGKMGNKSVMASVLIFISLLTSSVFARNNNSNVDCVRHPKICNSRGYRNDRGTRPVRVTRPTRPTRPDRVTRPTRPTRPDRVTRPTRPTRPVRVDREQRRRDIERERSRQERRQYRQYRHNPSNQYYSHTRRYNYRYNYHRTIPYRHIYHNNWIRFYVGYGYINGYVQINSYPYFVYNGYRHRYSRYDICDYDLVDSHYNEVTKTFYGRSCADSYDRCAMLRDDYNWNEYSNRYFCSEAIDYRNGRNSYDDYWYN
jgi:hypothetical protein